MDERKVDGTEFRNVNYFQRTGLEVNDSGVISEFLSYSTMYGNKLDVSGKFLIPTFIAPYLRGDYGDKFAEIMWKHLGDLVNPNFRSATIFKKYTNCSLDIDAIPSFIILNTEAKSTTPYSFDDESTLIIERQGVLIEELASMSDILRAFTEKEGPTAVQWCREWLKFMTASRAKRTLIDK